MTFYLTTPERPAPQRKRKQVSNLLDGLEEFLQIKAAVLHGRMKPYQSAIMTMGPDEAKKLDYKFPHRAAIDTLRRFLKDNGLEADYTLRKYETQTAGVWAVVVTYEPPQTKTQPHAEAVQTARRGKARKMA